MRQRSFNGTAEDFHLVWNFFTDIFEHQSWPSAWDFVRFEWWYYRLHALKHQDDPAFFSRNLELWLDEGKNLAALAISEEVDRDLFVQYRPRHSGLAAEILAWALSSNFAGSDTLQLYICQGDGPLTEAALQHGFKRKELDEYKNIYDLSRVEFDYSLKPGLVIQAASDKGFDHQSRMALIKNSFKRDHYPAQKYFFSMQAPSYNPHLDLSVVHPEDGHIAYCMGWINARTGQGVIEPVGAHSGHRRQGLASAVIKECFRRLNRLGAEEVHIGGVSPLYASLGPVGKTPSYRWEKRL